MRKLLMLTVLIGLLIGLSACGATVQQSVKAEQPSAGGDSVHAKYDASLGYHAYQHDEWIEDTPFGY